MKILRNKKIFIFSNFHLNFTLTKTFNFYNKQNQFLIRNFVIGINYDQGWDPDDPDYNHNEFYWGWKVYDTKKKEEGGNSSKFDEKGKLVDYVPYVVHNIRVDFVNYMNKLKNIKNNNDKIELINELKKIQWIDPRLAKRKNEDWINWLPIREKMLNENINKITKDDLEYIIREDYKVQDITCTYFFDRPWKWLRVFYISLFIACFFLKRICWNFYWWVLAIFWIIFIPLIIIFYIAMKINQGYHHPQHKLPKDYDRPTLCQDCIRKRKLEESMLWNNFWMIMILLSIGD